MSRAIRGGIVMGDDNVRIRPGLGRSVCDIGRKRLVVSILPVSAGPQRLDCFHATISEMDEQRSTPEPETAYELLQRGQAQLDKRHHAQAAIVLQRADRAEPGKASILEALGRAYFNSGQHEAARATFEQLLQLDPSAPYAHYALGQSLKRLGRRDEAGTHLRLAVALSPGSRLYRDALARLPSGSRRPPSVGTNLDPERPSGARESPGPSDDEADPTDAA